MFIVSWRRSFIATVLSALLCWGGSAAADEAARIERRVSEFMGQEAARQELIQKGSGLAKQLADLNRQLAVLDQRLRVIQAEGASLLREISSLNRSREDEKDSKGNTDRSAVADNRRIDAEISQLRLKYSTLDLEAAQVRQSGAVLINERKLPAADLSFVLEKCERLKRTWLALSDPFGRLARADHEATLVKFNEWLQANPRDDGALVARAFAHHRLDDRDKAIDDLTLAVEIAGPLHVVALAARGRLRIEAGEIVEGMKDMNNAGALDRKQPSREPYYYLLLGYADCVRGRYPEGLQHFKLAAKYDPDNVEAHRLPARLQATCVTDAPRNGKLALAEAKRACELTNDQDWACLHVLAAAHAECGDFDEAARCAQRAADVSPAECRQECLDRAMQYEGKQPLRLKW